MTALRIAIVAPEYPPALGGMQTYALEIAEGLAQQGHAVVVFTRFDAARHVESSALRVERKLRGNHFEDARTLACRRADFDVWHVMNAAYSWVALEHAPVVVSAHGNDVLNPNPVAGFGLRSRFGLPFGSRLDFRMALWRTPRMIRRAMPRVGHVIANSRATETLLLERYPSLKGKSSVAHPGVSRHFLEVPVSPGGKAPRGRLLTVARLTDKRKNVDRVLEALAHLKDDYQFTYKVVGTGDLRPGLEALVEEYGLSNRVTFVGDVSLSRLTELYVESDLFVLPSSETSTSVEGFGLVYLEANACGTPVLGARLGGAAEAVRDKVSGIQIAEPTCSAIEAALAAFLSGEFEFEPLACRSHALRFSWGSVVAHAVDCYQDLLHQPNKGGP